MEKEGRGEGEGEEERGGEEPDDDEEAGKGEDGEGGEDDDRAERDGDDDDEDDEDEDDAPDVVRFQPLHEPRVKEVVMSVVYLSVFVSSQQMVAKQVQLRHHELIQTERNLPPSIPQLTTEGNNKNTQEE